VPSESPAEGGRLIKKYPNRKLYDTRARRYITLERIGELVRAGEDIEVVDQASGEDLTAVTLSQILLDVERKKPGAVSEKVLRQLVTGPGEALIGAVRQSTSAVQELIQRAEEQVVKAPEAALEEALERTLRRLRIPSQRDLERFDRRLRELTQRLERLEGGAKAAAKPARPARKPGSRG
jgi:polyhydroxyalkanoate synthesis repressor PhaR